MDGIIGLGHFCETHGPCVILATQRCEEEPQQFPHSLTVPWCESCQSLNLDQSLISKESKTNLFYVTTRTPLQQDLAFLLKHAAVRSLSCEETSREGGTMYFGDNERGHILSHTFTLNDSLARGFHRKYCILILMRDKIHLLNYWPILKKSIKSIAEDLQAKASRVNSAEQSQCYQRAVRQAQGSPVSPARSLSQLTGELAIFAQLHMWFTWLLKIEPIVEKPNQVMQIPVFVSAPQVRALYHATRASIFRKACYCYLTGIRVEIDAAENGDLLAAFRQFLPTNWALPLSGEVCRLAGAEGEWAAEWSGCLPAKVPQLQGTIEDALANESMGDSTLEPFLVAAILRWRNIARTMSWVAAPNQQLMQSLGVQKWDLPMLAYWTSQCRSEASS